MALIQTFFAAGMSSSTIINMIPCMMAAPTAEGSEKAMRTMESERRRLSVVIARLSAAQDSLDELICANQRYRDSLQYEASS